MTKIIIDSASDFTQEEIKEFNLEPLYVSVIDTDDIESIYRDGLDIHLSFIWLNYCLGLILHGYTNAKRKVSKH